MTKRNELRERERVVSDAAWRVLARDGLAELSVRKVAAEAGVPPSSLRYLFPTQSGLREHAIDSLWQRIEDRLATHRHSVQDLEWAIALLGELLPLDDRRRLEVHAYVALADAAPTDEVLAGAYQRTHAGIRRVCEQVVESVTGRAPADVHVAHLHALVDGLALHLVRQGSEESTDWALHVLESHLRQLGSAMIPADAATA